MLSLPLGSRSLCCLSVACFEFIREESSAINYSPAWKLHCSSSLTFIFACCVYKLFIEKNNGDLG